MSERVSHSLVDALRSIPDLASLEDAILLEIVGASANLYWSAGSRIFEAGEPAEELYIVLSGRVRIFQPDDDEERDVATIGPGDYFGEHALLLHTSHTMTAEAAENSELMVVPRDPFQSILDANPEFARQLRRKLESRWAEQRAESGS